KTRTWDARYSRHWELLWTRDGSKKAAREIISVLNKSGFGLREGEFETDSEDVFGAYLAGLIDGDGSVQIRNSSDGYTRELLLKIASQNRAAFEKLRKHLRRFGQADGYISKYPNHYDFWVYVNKNLFKWLDAKVVSHLAISRKRRRLRLGARRTAPLSLGSAFAKAKTPRKCRG
ncbi:hypothetical protein COU36_04250, partial [Candidatus Micrarchaeota archaeon CG10_big_fil_rev_8_21_14_0_10_59_7]